MAEPWWLATAGAVIGGLVAAVAKLYRDNVALRSELAARNALVEGEHKRDLRRVIWGPTDPPRKP